MSLDNNNLPETAAEQSPRLQKERSLTPVIVALAFLTLFCLAGSFYAAFALVDKSNQGAAIAAVAAVWGAIAGGAFAVIASQLTERQRFSNEMRLRKEQRIAEFQRETLLDLQRKFLRLATVGEDAVNADILRADALKDGDNVEAIKHAAQRNKFQAEHWEVMWEVRLLNERVLADALREEMERAVEKNRQLVMEPVEIRRAIGPVTITSPGLVQLRSMNRAIGVAIRAALNA